MINVAVKTAEIRSILVAQDLNFSKGKSGPDELFAPTPPFVAARYATSQCASSGRMPRELRRSLMALDFEKAFLNGNIKRDVCIVLPPEDSRSNGCLNVGYLRTAMYGLREAPAIWQDVVQNRMEQLGFVACVIMPCVYFHPGRDVLVVAHVDYVVRMWWPEGATRAIARIAEPVRVWRWHVGSG